VYLCLFWWIRMWFFAYWYTYWCILWCTYDLCILIHILIYIHWCIWMNIYIDEHMYTYIDVYGCIYILMYIFIHILIYVDVYIYWCVSLFIYWCIWILVRKHNDVRPARNALAEAHKHKYTHISQNETYIETYVDTYYERTKARRRKPALNALAELRKLVQHVYRCCLMSTFATTCVLSAIYVLMLFDECIYAYTQTDMDTFVEAHTDIHFYKHRRKTSANQYCST